MKTSLAFLISLFLFISFSALAKETSSKDSPQSYPKAHFNPEAKPSFDCKKAKTTYERLACTDPEVAKLDVELNKAYKKARARIKGKIKASKGTGERVFCKLDYLEIGEAGRGIGKYIIGKISLGGVTIKDTLPYQACFSISKKDDDYYLESDAEDGNTYYGSYALGANIISDEIKDYQNSMFDIEVNNWDDGFAAPRLKRHICILNALELSQSILWVSVPGHIGAGFVPISDKTFACIKKYPKGVNGGHETTIEKNNLWLYRE